MHPSSYKGATPKVATVESPIVSALFVMSAFIKVLCTGQMSYGLFSGQDCTILFYRFRRRGIVKLEKAFSGQRNPACMLGNLSCMYRVLYVGFKKHSKCRCPPSKGLPDPFCLNLA